MRRLTWAALGATASAAAALGGVLFATRALAHCDTLEGPVVSAARRALDAGDVGPILKWIRPEDEKEVRTLFAKVLAVRKLGGPAKELAERALFENVVRLHRAGEGESYTGIAPEGATLEPGIALADEALETGSLDALKAKLGGSLDAALEERFRRVAEAKPHAEENVAKGRAYVAAYVDFIHFVERLHGELEAPAGAPHAAHAKEAAAPAHVH